ncbi:MAG: type II toxin-antitoxin system VapC family toxin [Planctomycetes bacterium]|nr:type II toxin-antitoxin system VapC family toxin [Planctomycetota bacterium]
MKRYLLDTGIMGDFINRRRGVDDRAREARKQGASVGTCMPVVGELFFGVEASQTRDENRKRLTRALSGIPCWPYSREAAEEYGRLAAELKRIGRSMQQIDIMIAAIARTLGDCTVVSRDSDLTEVPGLPVEDWAT